jgi:predicted dehydrogenase
MPEHPELYDYIDELLIRRSRTEPASDPVRIGVVGCGSVATAYASLTELMRSTGEAEVTMACDVHGDLVLADGATTVEERARRLWPAATFTADHEDVIASSDVDLVLVLTSVQHHCAIATAALEAGKHVLVEKPMATTLEDAKALLECSQRSPGLLVCAPHVILSPTFRIMWNRVRQGDIGKVLLARAIYGEPFGDGLRSWAYRSGGGVLGETGVYNLTSLTGLLGPARRVTAFAGTGVPDFTERDGTRAKSQILDNAQVLLDFGEACYAVVTMGYNMQKKNGPAIELYGTGGTLQMLGEDWLPEGYELWSTEDEAWRVSRADPPYWLWIEGLRHIVECIRSGGHPLITPEHAYHVLEIMVNAEASALDGQARALESEFPVLELASDESRSEFDTR